MGLRHTILIVYRDRPAVTEKLLSSGVSECAIMFCCKAGWEEAEGWVLTILVLVCSAPHLFPSHLWFLMYTSVKIKDLNKLGNKTPLRHSSHHTLQKDFIKLSLEPSLKITG